MTSSELQVGKSSEGNEPHVLRPTPAKVGKDSHRLKKTSTAARRRAPPVIIYAVSPEIIHVKPSEFMPLVQRLTGPSSFSIPEENHDMTSNNMAAANHQTLSLRTKKKDGNGVHDWNNMNPAIDRSASAFNLAISTILSSAPPIDPSIFLPSPLSGFGGFLNEQRSPSLYGNNHSSNSLSAASLKDDSHSHDGGGDLWYCRRI